jgi:NHLM bacteriocin system ABC transporter peptidase/ATP-binding protein
MEAAECGAACLAIILAWHGRHVSLETVRQECGVSRDGSRALNILSAAEHYGLEAGGYTTEPEYLDECPLPAILFWNFNHFVVFEGRHGTQYALNDPECGPRLVSPTEFHESFTGVVLTFQPSPAFQPGGHKTGLGSFLRPWLRDCLGLLPFFLLCGLGILIPGLVLPGLSQIFIDDILIRRSSGWIGPLLCGLIGTGLVRTGFVALQQYGLIRLEEKLALTSAARLFWHLLHLPLTFFGQRYAGELASRVAIHQSIARFLARHLTRIVFNLASIVFYGLLMLAYDPLMTLTVLVVALGNVGLLSLIARKIRLQKLRLLQERGKLGGTVMAALKAIESLKASANEEELFARYSAYQAKVIQAEQQLGWAANLFLVIPGFLASLSAGALLIIGSFRVMAGTMSMGMLVAFQSLAALFLEPVESLVRIGGLLPEMQGNMKRIEDVMEYPIDHSFQVDMADSEPLSSPIQCASQLEIRHIDFGYGPPDQLLLRDISLNLKPGQRIALVGGSGSGKSTLARLISGLYRPWRGEILFNGQPRESIPGPIWRQTVALVDQQITLFQGSIRENLSLWDNRVPEADLIAAARDSLMHERIIGLPQGYDSLIEEGGRNFSGGERQRLEIARALVRQPSLLILDEATSALDPLTEKELDQHLRQRGCTLLIIAHRLSTIRDCDEIIVMDQGRIVEQGTHDGLIAQNDLYARLLNA